MPETTHVKNPGQADSRPRVGRVLALDLGAKRVGVAVSDETGVAVRRLSALPRSNWKQLLRQIAELCEGFDVKTLVIGLPLRLDGTEGEAATEARRVARNLELSLPVEIRLQDERLTSRAAEENLRAEGFGGKEIKKLVDSEAAALILRDFLTHMGA